MTADNPPQEVSEDEAETAARRASFPVPLSKRRDPYYRLLKNIFGFGDYSKTREDFSYKVTKSSVYPEAPYVFAKVDLSTLGKPVLLEPSDWHAQKPKILPIPVGCYFKDSEEYSYEISSTIMPDVYSGDILQEFKHAKSIGHGNKNRVRPGLTDIEDYHGKGNTYRNRGYPRKKF